MNILKSLVLTFGVFIASHANAGFITTNEADLDAIFSQSSFENMPIDIRIGAVSELIFPGFLDITSDAEVNQLFNMHIGGRDVVNFYFIDSINICGGTVSSSIVGCGEFPGNDFVVESSFAAGSFGGELLAHELGHNLGLNHRVGGLMNPSLNNDTILSNNEVTTIRNSSLVQTDGQGFWINISPVLIVSAASIPVPEPSTLALLLLATGFLVRKNIKK
ncbi:PEP-CTERM sorting domain-containing protein [Colwellia sp. Arc7-635]|uniref:PEP-CTERM sorting domain-containing protein n=1 Tax=Colwellia sp. Arc7-635 TaxID=2497879 RepID=UPI000F85ACF8|nr:PEP-CTERM sorting domain-containing protein [Colwellia sp. Arc7-635]AZQ84862.1 PEP-CTERM sorting domain-containing protein [Colwellia sp. Arc7-635]